MNQRVGWPVVLVLVALLATGLYAYYRYVFLAPQAPINTAADIPARQPGDDKPATPPSGMVVPGTIKR
jgi:hypothetical protein